MRPVGRPWAVSARYAATLTSSASESVRNILGCKDKRLLMVIGPCSIHDVNAAHEYADKLLALSKEIEDSIYVVMRVYFEKPRT
ncbi:3-deoxy-7-phosphoheptulonate synthase, partial [Mycobacterium tuberculosis]|nr:3-deoxy-7-phosphoheptulonate synthase [Mycobacterium tuberculosis]